MKLSNLTNSSLAHHFFYETEDASASNFFTAKNCTEIYSYGYHFEMARKITKQGVKYLLVNSRTYSSSTSQHQMYLRQAIPASEYVIIDMPYIHGTQKLYMKTESEKNIQYFKIQLSDRYRQFLSARKLWTKENYRSSFISIYENYEDYLKLFGIRKVIPKTLRLKLAHLLSDEVSEELSNVRKAEDLKQAIKDARNLELNKAKIALWIDGGSAYLPHSISTVFLRLVKVEESSKTGNGLIVSEEIQTSKGATMKLSEAKKLYDNILNKLDVIGQTYDKFTVINCNGLLTIGCHKIGWTEIERIAKVLNWKSLNKIN